MVPRAPRHPAPARLPKTSTSGCTFTSDFTLLGPLRFHLFRQVRKRAESLGRAHGLHEDRVVHALLGEAAAVGRRPSVVRRPSFPSPLLRDLTPAQGDLRVQRMKPRLTEVWDSLAVREEEPHTAVVVPWLHPRPERAAEDLGGELLRGAAAFPPHPVAQPASADGVRHLAARPPDHPRVLPAVPGRHPRQPRPLAPDAAVRRRRLAALAHREDPGAAAPHRTDPAGSWTRRRRT